MNIGDKFKVGKQGGKLGMNHEPKIQVGGGYNTKNDKYNWPFDEEKKVKQIEKISENENNS